MSGQGGYQQGQGGQQNNSQMIYQQQQHMLRQQQLMQQQQQQQQAGMGGMQGQMQQQPQQQMNYGQGMQQHYQQQQQQMMMGQPAPQMSQQMQMVSQQQTQPRSPLVHNVQQQQMNMGQSPLATGNPLSVGGPMGPGSQGPLSVQQHTMGPGSQGPLSVQQINGPQSTGGDYLAGPQSVTQSQQPLSVQQQSGGPHSVGGGPLSVPSVPPQMGPMSVQPTTPMNPASQPPNQGQAPSTPAQGGQATAASWSVTTDLPRETASPEPCPAIVSDPSAHVKGLILKDLRHCIVRMNIVAGDSLKERKLDGSSGRTPDDVREDQLKTMDNFLAVCDQVETNLTLLLETSKHIGKFERIFDKDASKQDQSAHTGAIENYVESTQAMQKMLDKAMNHLNKTRETLKKREEMSNMDIG